MKNFILTIFLFVPFALQSQNPIALCREMFAAISDLQTMHLKMEAYERCQSGMVTTKFMIKRSRKPLNLYYKQSFPTNGAEVLLNKTGKVWVNPGTFPWVTLELDPNSSLLRKDQHHGILDAGYDHFALLLSEMFKKYADSLSHYVKLNAIEIVGTTDCYKITFTHPSYHIYNYKTTKNETLLSLASRFRISEYKIGELNKISSVTQAIPAGTTLKLPCDYAKSMTLWLDTKTKLPMKMEVYDEKGLFEKYIFTGIVINPVFKANEFDKDFPDYNFK